MAFAFVLFRLQHQSYALSIEGLSEIMPLIAVERTPNLPSEVLGLASIRGKITQVIDLRAYLGLPPIPPALNAPLMVLADEKYQVALLVDSIERIEYQHDPTVTLDNTPQKTILYQQQLLTIFDWKTLLHNIYSLYPLK